MRVSIVYSVLSQVLWKQNHWYFSSEGFRTHDHCNSRAVTITRCIYLIFWKFAKMLNLIILYIAWLNVLLIFVCSWRPAQGSISQRVRTSPNFRTNPKRYEKRMASPKTRDKTSLNSLWNLHQFVYQRHIVCM